MTGQFDGKVAFITGAARGQGRAHAVRFAEEGAAIIAVDICEQIDTVAYPMSCREDLDETVNLVEKTGGRIIAEQADVRDFARLQSVLADAVAELGRLDFVLANAGVLPGVGLAQPTASAYVDAIDVMLNGVYYTIEAALPHLARARRGRGYRHHQLGSGPQIIRTQFRNARARPRRLRRGQARGRRIDALLRNHIGGEGDSGELRASDRGGNADDSERDDG